ncbi:DUF2599 domain-containing protein [Streptomyces sp. NPDC028635]|uniref:DUF2599 domain-containing protein n=1 Tax=Streptomyces sp. NPDC028635 TaxID=3154800 RepID=UPI0033DC3A81
MRLIILLATSCLVLLGVQAVPASAQVFCGTHSVDGAIWTQYTQTPGMQDALGCPTSDELVVPDGVGRRQVFEHGSIYWSPDSGAHTVWGVIGDRWGQCGWEGGNLGYPLTDEIKNPDGRGVRQQFQRGSIYWSPSTGAHPVWGLIGWYWGKQGYEGGFFGYPTSDEYPGTKIGGPDDANTGVRQDFEHSRYLLYSPGQGSAPAAFDSCGNACIGYGAAVNSRWVVKTEVYVNLGDQRARTVDVTPTNAAYKTVNPLVDSAVDDMSGLWKQTWSNLDPIYFPNATQTETNSVYEQLYCHAKYSYAKNSAEHFGGPTWDLEVWRPDIGMDNLKMLQSKCNWGPDFPQ